MKVVVTIGELTTVPGRFKDYYVDLETGDIFSSKRLQMKKLKPSYSESSGYWMITLTDDEGKQHSFTQHAIVMAAKQKMPINSWRVLGLTVHHRNENRDDNSADNLELCSSSAQFTNDLKQRLSEEKTGRSRYKLTEQDVMKILMDFSEYEGNITQYSRMVADQYSVSQINAYKLLKRETWKNVEIS